MTRCDQEMCPNWAGDGGCPCAVLGIEHEETQNCRECREGKHGACNGTALIDDGLNIIEADCICASGGHS